MGTCSLICHPDTPPIGVRGVQVAWRQDGAALALEYRVEGAGLLVIPPPAAPERADNLWQTTCFELFVKGAGSAYAEYNFSPSSRWAAYRFSAYREGMAPAPVAQPPRVTLRRAGDAVIGTVAIGLPDEGPLHIGLCAVIAETGGRTSYWALAHAPGKPDFHNAACFTLAIAAAEAP